MDGTQRDANAAATFIGQIGHLHWPITLPQTRGLLVASDLLAILSSSLITGTGYHLLTTGHPGRIDNYLSLAFAQAAVLIPLLAVRNAYSTDLVFLTREKAGALAVYWTATILLLIALGFSLKITEQFSRGAVLSFAVCGLSLTIAQRAILRRVIVSALVGGRIRPRKAVVVCFGDQIHEEERLLQRGYHLCGKVTVDYSAAISANADAVLSAIRRSEAEEILLAVPWSKWLLVKQLLLEINTTPLPVRLLPDDTAAEILRHCRRETGFGPSFEIKRAPLSTSERIAKRTFDLLFASIALVILSPLLILVAVAVKLDSPGPVLFQQSRIGFNGHPFQIFKFRSMRVMEDGEIVRQARRGDKRITRIGAWLRRLSLDELPQLLNVLRGDMSLIGPRPHAIAHDYKYQDLISKYAHRHHMKPGITGLAQARGFRGETSTLEMMKGRVELDLWYISNWSLWLDVQILLRTGLILLRPHNVY